jgi:ubiquinone/menaquinone biosynthesis C-methylase UbiE
MTIEDLKNIPAQNGVVLLTEQAPGEKNDLYLKARTLEGRLYDDSVVAILPNVPNLHPLKREWEVRRKSSARLVEYLKKKNARLPILDVGCGNGWMSNLLSHIPDSVVFALDLNLPELEQGARVFSKNSSLHFLYADLFESPLPENAFDIISVASAIQYFPDLPVLIERLLRLLKQSGEIHLLDSPLYTDAAVEAARRRSKAYYGQIGVPEMCEFYFHHTYSSLKDYPHDFQYRPNSIKSLLLRNASPFPWIRIRKQK